VLDLRPRLERVLYTRITWSLTAARRRSTPKQLLTEMDTGSAEQYGDGFVAKMGAERVKDLLSRIDLRRPRMKLEHQLDTTEQQIKKKVAKR